MKLTPRSRFFRGLWSASRLMPCFNVRPRLMSYPCSYQSSCRDQPWHRRHEVQPHWWLHPGHRPAVENVFQTVPHPSNNGSGESVPSQHQRLEGVGRHSQSGQRIRLNRSSSSGLGTLIVRSSVTGARLSSCHTLMRSAGSAVVHADVAARIVRIDRSATIRSVKTRREWPDCPPGSSFDRQHPAPTARTG